MHEHRRWCGGPAGVPLDRCIGECVQSGKVPAASAGATTADSEADQPGTFPSAVSRSWKPPGLLRPPESRPGQILRPGCRRAYQDPGTGSQRAAANSPAPAPGSPPMRASVGDSSRARTAWPVRIRPCVAEAAAPGSSRGHHLTRTSSHGSSARRASNSASQSPSRVCSPRFPGQLSSPIAHYRGRASSGARIDRPSREDVLAVAIRIRRRLRPSVRGRTASRRTPARSRVQAQVRLVEPINVHSFLGRHGRSDNLKSHLRSAWCAGHY